MLLAIGEDAARLTVEDLGGQVFHASISLITAPKKRGGRNWSPTCAPARRMLDAMKGRGGKPRGVKQGFGDSFLRVQGLRPTGSFAAKSCRNSNIH